MLSKLQDFLRTEYKIGEAPGGFAKAFVDLKFSLDTQARRIINSFPVSKKKKLMRL